MQYRIALSVLFLLSSGTMLNATQAPTKTIDYIPAFYEVVEKYRGGQQSATDILRGVAIFQFSEHEKNVSEYVQKQGINVKKVAQDKLTEVYKNFKDKVAAKTVQRKDAADLVAIMRFLDKGERAAVAFQLEEDGLLNEYEKWLTEWSDDWKKKMKEYDARLKTKPAETKTTQEKVHYSDLEKILDEISYRQVQAVAENKAFSITTEEKNRIRAWYQSFGAQAKNFEQTIKQQGLWDLIYPIIKDIKSTAAASSSATASRTAASSAAAPARTSTPSSAASASTTTTSSLPSVSTSTTQTKQEDSPLIVLKTRKADIGQGVYDCSFEVIKHAKAFYDYAKKNQNIDQQKLEKILVAEVAPAEWYKKAGCGIPGTANFMPEPEFDEIQKILNEVLPSGSYVLFNQSGFYNQLAENKKQPQEILKNLKDDELGKAVVHIQQNRNALKFFITNFGAHWFVIAVNKVNGVTTYYVMDDLYHEIKDAQHLTKDNKRAVSLLKSLIEGKKTIIE